MNQGVTVSLCVETATVGIVREEQFIYGPGTLRSTSVAIPQLPSSIYFYYELCYNWTPLKLEQNLWPDDLFNMNLFMYIDRFVHSFVVDGSSVNDANYVLGLCLGVLYYASYYRMWLLTMSARILWRKDKIIFYYYFNMLPMLHLLITRILFTRVENRFIPHWKVWQSIHAFCFNCCSF
jgi:hypothetical protein